jgi:hypothetical protein
MNRCVSIAVHFIVYTLLAETGNRFETVFSYLAFTRKTNVYVAGNRTSCAFICILSYKLNPYLCAGSEVMP